MTNVAIATDAPNSNSKNFWKIVFLYISLNRKDRGEQFLQSEAVDILAQGYDNKIIWLLMFCTPVNARGRVFMVSLLNLGSLLPCLEPVVTCQ